MGESQVFEFDGKVYALLNKSGTTYLYDMEKGESVFLLKENINYIMVSI